MEKEPKIKDWSEVTITNRFMFNKVFTSNPEACKRLLEILLGFKISEIKPPQKEVTFETNLEKHAVRFDIYTEDGKNMYDIEMQTSFETDLPERSRFYQGVMDVDSLGPGKPYSALKNSIVIFICTFDPFGTKEPAYKFKNINILDKTTELNDRSVKMFFNVNEYDKITDDNELKGLLKYFAENKTDTNFTSSLSELVNMAKHNESWRKGYMDFERFQYYAEKRGIQQGIAQQKAEDEKIISAERKKLSQRDLEIKKLRAEIERLKASSHSF